MNLQLGFIGTGVITDAVVRGICRANISAKILVSSRNQQISAKLAEDLPQVTQIDSNQQIIDESDYIFIALRRQILAEELSKLNFYSKQLISFVPTISRKLLADYTSLSINNIYRAVPLPFIAENPFVTPFFPQHNLLNKIFNLTGGTIVPNNEQQFDCFMLGGSMMGIYFQFAGVCADYLSNQGVDKQQANLYVSRLFSALAEQSSKLNDVDFRKLQAQFSTPGGTNELISSLFRQNGGEKILTSTFNQAFNINS